MCNVTKKCDIRFGGLGYFLYLCGRKQNKMRNMKKADEYWHVKALLLFVVLPIALGVYLQVSKKRSEPKMSEAERVAMMDSIARVNKREGLLHLRDAIVRLNEAGGEKNPFRREELLDEALMHIEDADMCLFGLPYDSGSIDPGETLYFVETLIEKERDKYTLAPSGVRLMKKSYTEEIKIIWDVIDLYYR